LHSGRDGSKQRGDETLELINRSGVIERTIAAETVERGISDTSEFRSEHLNVTRGYISDIDVLALAYHTENIHEVSFLIEHRLIELAFACEQAFDGILKRSAVVRPLNIVLLDFHSRQRIGRRSISKE
jgi:hypothetical protein